ncbi:hypothetical protein PR048_002668 [Dryococelus australis]|uniref:Uncharacterized protein n=1 Tax=Dryococelus australis TaxID=614101 RepID=A0ABQ9ILJ7_9NEOP|nr:hypothetical protein PR048_002668 [Dryococelus australis]
MKSKEEHGLTSFPTGSPEVRVRKDSCGRWLEDHSWHALVTGKHQFSITEQTTMVMTVLASESTSPTPESPITTSGMILASSNCSSLCDIQSLHICCTFPTLAKAGIPCSGRLELQWTPGVVVDVWHRNKCLSLTSANAMHMHAYAHEGRRERGRQLAQVSSKSAAAPRESVALVLKQASLHSRGSAPVVKGGGPSIYMETCSGLIVKGGGCLAWSFGKDENELCIGGLRGQGQFLADVRGGGGWPWSGATRRLLAGFRHLNSSPNLMLHNHDTGILDFAAFRTILSRRAPIEVGVVEPRNRVGSWQRQRQAAPGEIQLKSAVARRGGARRRDAQKTIMGSNRLRGGRRRRASTGNLLAIDCDITHPQFTNSAYTAVKYSNLVSLQENIVKELDSHRLVSWKRFSRIGAASACYTIVTVTVHYRMIDNMCDALKHKILSARFNSGGFTSHIAASECNIPWPRPHKLLLALHRSARIRLNGCRDEGATPTPQHTTQASITALEISSIWTCSTAAPVQSHQTSRCLLLRKTIRSKNDVDQFLEPRVFREFIPRRGRLQTLLLFSPTVLIGLQFFGHVPFNCKPGLGDAVAERLARSPTAKANRVQSLTGSPDIRNWGIVPDDAAGRRVSSGIPRFLHPPPPHSGAAPYSLQSPSSALKTPLKELASHDFSPVSAHDVTAERLANDLRSRFTLKASLLFIAEKKEDIEGLMNLLLHTHIPQASEMQRNELLIVCEGCHIKLQYYDFFKGLRVCADLENGRWFIYRPRGGSVVPTSHEATSGATLTGYHNGCVRISYAIVAMLALVLVAVADR